MGLWLEPANLMTYRFAGVAPNPDQFVQRLWAGVAAQYVIHRTNRPLERYGLVTLYNRERDAEHCGIALVLSEEARGIGWPFVGAGLAIEHWFRVTRCNKIWAEVPAWNLPLLDGIRLFGFVEEGVQRDHEWLDGRLWDRHLFALFRRDWEAGRPLWDRPRPPQD